LTGITTTPVTDTESLYTDVTDIIDAQTPLQTNADCTPTGISSWGGVFWYSVTSPVNATVVISTTKSGSNTNFNAIYVIGGSSSSCSTGLVGCTKTSDVCGSGNPPKVTLQAGVAYLLAVVKLHGDTNAGTTFDIIFTYYVGGATENFESPVGQIPTGWVATEGKYTIT
jgi:hypothetical protein